MYNPVKRYSVRPALLLLHSIQERQAARLSALIVPADVVDPAWPTIVRATRLSRPLHVMMWSTAPLDERRPLVLA